MIENAPPIRNGFRQALALTLIVWFGFVYGSYVVSELIGGRTGFLQDLPLDVPAVFLVALVALALYPLALATIEWSPGRRWLVVFIAAVLVAGVQSVINMVENRMLGVIPAFDADHMPMIRERFGRNFLSHVYLSFADGALLIFLLEARRGSDQRVRLAQAETLAAQAQNAALRLQLNPHFLFNTLNSISSLVVVGRNADAEEMLARLSEFLRRSLEAEPSGMARLDEEFAAAETYLEIEAVRFGERMATEFVLPPALAGAMVPHFILQPVVENAVKYGVARSPEPVTICVVADRVEDALVLTISDDACKPVEASESRSGFGIGLANVRDRLAQHYGPAGALALDARDDGFTGTIRLPLST